MPTNLSRLHVLETLPTGFAVMGTVPDAYAPQLRHTVLVDPEALAGASSAPGAAGVTQAAMASAIAAAIAAIPAPVAASPTVAVGLVAAGATAAAALPLTAVFNVIGTVPAGTGVVLPAATQVIVLNRGASPLNVYPPGTGTIEGGAPSAPAQVQPGSEATFVSTDKSNFFAM